MNTSEWIRHVDELIAIGNRLHAANKGRGSDLKEDSGAVRNFFGEVGGLVEKILGETHPNAKKFSANEPCNAQDLEQGIAILQEIRKIILYSGELGH